ncbi:sulfatase-like hydrolase/transferase [Winogradskyella sp.]|nr:sulfatase-like hydrolase/transferase [Winogradskyella sp.]MDB4752538.1 sulfatase-like hydrolase/transferase [Winogradskyella sp.]
MVKTIYLIFGLLLSYSTIQAQISKTPPNILFIAVDDLKPTIGAFGDDLAHTPNIDLLAENATVFLNNHTQQAVCGPSRASLLTGKRPDYTQVRDLKTKMRDMVPDIITIPQYLKDNGYETIGLGKIFDPRCVDKYRDKPSWSSPYLPEHQFDYPDDYGPPSMGFYQDPKIKAHIQELRKEAKANGVKNLGKFLRDTYKPPFEKTDAPDDAYVDGALTVQANKFLDQYKLESNKPFFLAVGFKRPHLPFTAPKRYWEMYDQSKFKIAEFQENSKNGPSIAYHSSGELRSYITPEISYEISKNNRVELSEEFQRDLIHGYYASTSFIDAQIGKIVDKLKETGLDQNTIILIWGDHGWHLGDHGLWNKHSNFEQATRSPLLILDPRVNKKIQIDSPTEFVDVFPTLCATIGLPIPNNLDGKNLMPLIRGDQLSIKPFAVSQWTNAKKTGYSFRTDHYRYTVWLNGKKSTDPIYEEDIFAEELYDYRKDPAETRNLAEDESSINLIKRFQKLAANFFNTQSDIPLKNLVKTSNKKLHIGATLNHHELGGKKEELFLKDFTFLTPANAAKQQRVYPKPGVWQWDRIEEFLEFSKTHNLTLRIHGPISPQASKWVKEDDRTAQELEEVMIEFMTASAKRYNEEPSVKYMDVVNETILPDGSWFGPKQGTNSWENPWLTIGLDENGFPKYIVKAFEIATKHAPNVKLVYNQNAGMQKTMWNKVKETILYLRSKGLRVDGIGWQGHLKLSRTTGDFIENTDEALIELSNLIDWAHANDLDFHVTELDYKVIDKSKLEDEFQTQAIIYQKIVNVLQSKTSTGVVTLNLWDMGERFKKPNIYFQSIYDNEYNPTPAYIVIKNALRYND